MARKKLEASIKQLSETVKFNETDLEEKFVQQEKEYVLRSNQTQREMDSKSNKEMCQCSQIQNYHRKWAKWP